MTQPNLRLVEGTSVDKTKALDAALSQIERAFGKGSIMRLGKNQKAVEIETVPTGSLGLDIALGVGGLPRGRVIEIYGPESSGKTTLTLHVIAEAQKKGGVCAFVDAEHALDPVYARKLGVNLNDLLISQPDTGEQALEITDTLVRSGAVDVLVIDSVAALTPRAEIEGEMGESQPGLQARLMSQALRKLTASISRSNTMVIFINRGHVWLARDDVGRQCAEVLCFCPSRYSPHRRDQGARASRWQPDTGQGGQEQGRAAVQAG
jgi:recombination protein RecA